MTGPEAQAGQPGRADEYRVRLDGLRSVLEERGDAAAVLSTRRNIAWLTVGASMHVLQSSESAAAAMLVTRDDVVVITQNIEAERLEVEELGGLEIEVAAVPWWQPEAIEAEIGRRFIGGSAVARDLDLEPLLVSMRSALSPLERERLARLGADASEALEATVEAAVPGMSEDDLVADLLGRLPGCRVPVVLAAADARIHAYRHPLPGTTQIRTRVMLVLVAERSGLHVALTRIREFEPPDAELVRRLEAVGEIQAAMHAATRPGRTFDDVFEAARTAYAETGYPDAWREHHQGGSIGYQARERIAMPGDQTVIDPGMAFAWNPSIAGAKAEDTLVLEDGAALLITD